jgi:hypothetical protein
MPLAAAVWLGSLAAVTGAQGKTGGIPANESLSVTGSLTYAWHGDPARGCAREGLCGVVGAIVFKPDGSTDAFSIGQQIQNLDLSGATTVRVRRNSVGSEGSGDCVAVSSYADLSLDFTASGRPIEGGPLSSGRCAGPTSQDLGRVPLPWKVTGRRLRTIDARGRVPFVAGPFRGELISTILMRPDRSESSSSGGGPSFIGHPPPRRLVEFVDLRYTVSNGPGMLDTTFAGTTAPSCEELDSCGVRGSLTASLMPYHETLRIVAARVIKHRVGDRRAIADFRDGRLPLYEAVPLFDGRIRLRISETLTRNAAPGCSDSVVVGGRPIQGLYLTFDSPFRAAIAAELGVATDGPGGTTPGILRTHCPGPSILDAVAPTQLEPSSVARGLIEPRQLLEHQFSVLLAIRGRRFHGLGYSGAAGGHLGLTMSLSKVRAGTERLRFP